MDAALEAWKWVEIAFRNARFAGVALVHRDHTILRCTPSFAALLGRDPSEVEGHKVEEFSRPQDQLQTDCKFEDIFHGDGFVSTEKYYVSPLGKLLPRRLESKAIPESDGTRIACISTLTEIPSSQIEVAKIRKEFDEIRSKLERPTVVVTQTDNSNNADRGSQITNNQATVMWAVVAAVGLMMATLCAMLLNGNFSIRDGDRSIEVNSDSKVQEQIDN